jgi:hypothetical protein
MNKRTLKNDFLELEYLTASLRISGLTPKGKSNLFADLNGEPPIATPYGDFYFRGGHRLWHAPEAMPRTYAPDTGELKITDLPDGVILETNTEPGTGIRKRIEIRLAADAPTVHLTHTLINDGMWAVKGLRRGRLRNCVLGARRFCRCLLIRWMKRDCCPTERFRSGPTPASRTHA